MQALRSLIFWILIILQLYKQNPSNTHFFCLSNVSYFIEYKCGPNAYCDENNILRGAKPGKLDKKRTVPWKDSTEPDKKNIGTDPTSWGYVTNCTIDSQ